MNESYFNVFKVSIFLIYILSFLFSLKVFRSKNSPRYMKSFFLYPLIGAIISFVYLPIVFIQSRTNLDFFNRVNLISLLFHFPFLGLFILRIIKSKHAGIMRITLWSIFVILVIISIADFYQDTSSLSFCLANFTLIIFCLFYYYQLFQDIPTENLTRNPSFWIITGIFIGMGLSFPIIIFWDYLEINLNRSAKRVYQAFTNLPYIAMHLFFIKANLCSIQTLKKY